MMVDYTPLLEMVKWVCIISTIGLWTKHLINFLLGDVEKDKRRKDK